ncbi:TetR/AcrR family transcriptional regulator [Streptosporangium amethystogenes]|uniref:TetR/AcrR family transcriptional regulator n=1 Tax=Streptosporangium amethystogenes TaxID=2002 RepID=UPI001B8019C3|nr:TetR/AcrR family transcriptional regulator [Streptosporangium amethystogenes]
MGRPPQDASQRLARAHHILDIAGDLILRWGYDKTTVEDIARRAGVAKGTIYLHWKTREELFAALLRRERVEMIIEVRRRIREGPATLRELLRLLASETLSRPLIRASVLGDSEVLGRLTRQKRDRTAGAELDAGFRGYFDTLLEHGALRSDLSSAEHVTTLASVLYGFLSVSPMMPAGYRPADERLAELIADTVGRALEPGGPTPAADARAVARATLEYVDAVVEAARRKLRVSLGSEESTP